MRVLITCLRGDNILPHVTRHCFDRYHTALQWPHMSVIVNIGPGNGLVPSCWPRSMSSYVITRPCLKSPATRWFVQPFVEPTSQKASNPHYCLFCWGNPPVTGGFPTKGTSNTENISQPWHHHGQYPSLFESYVSCACDNDLVNQCMSSFLKHGIFIGIRRIHRKILFKIDEIRLWLAEFF